MSKDKWVRRFSVDETSRHKNGFTIYKITSFLFPIESPEAMTVVSVWKRYSDVKSLHASMKGLHAGLHLRGTFPPLPKFSYFKRFQQDVIEERARVIKSLLEFIAGHKLLFTSTDFVNFLQTGYEAPQTSERGAIDDIRSSLHLPIEEAPLDYQGGSVHPDGLSSRVGSAYKAQQMDEPASIQAIPVYTGAEDGPVARASVPRADSFDSLASLDSAGSDFYTMVDNITIEKHESLVRKPVLPDLITFEAPSTGLPSLDDYHNMGHVGSNSNSQSDSVSISSSANQRPGMEASTNHRSEISLATDRSDSNLTTAQRDYTRSNSRVSTKSVLSLSNPAEWECKTRTEDSYVFEAGHLLNLAARYEDMKEYGRAFECYKAGIEKMLIGVQTDGEAQRRALIKQKINKYLSYAESIYQDHLCHSERRLLPESTPQPYALHCPIPVSLLRRPYAELAMYRVVAVLDSALMLALHRAHRACFAIKVIQKVPNNLTEFDEYFLQNTQETRQPVLPTVIPYMVPLHAYIETNNLIFLILSYAPGQKLFDYIKNYIKSLPNTPAREVNLENVFSEPKIRKTDVENENLNSVVEVKTDLVQKDSEISVIETVENKDCSNNNNRTDFDNLDTKELVKNSQNLLRNVEKVLSEVNIGGKDVNSTDEVDKGISKQELKEKIDGNTLSVDKMEKVVTPVRIPSSPARAPETLPEGTVCEWGAQILTALESLHNCGVICRDLNPSNILLGEQGQIILTYFYSYEGLEMSLSKLRRGRSRDTSLYVAPELYDNVCLEDKDEGLERVCDFWSFGAVMYELICAVPLQSVHVSRFTSHTCLQFPRALPPAAADLLTQLLKYEPSERLGANGIEEIKQHPYFQHIDWHLVYESWKVPG